MERNSKDFEAMEPSAWPNCDAADTTANNDENTQTTSAEKAEKAAHVKEQRPRYAGRVTLGIALVVMGLLMVAGLLFPDLDLTKLAKFAPLILVALGLEILVSSMRHPDCQVKVGFGMVFLSLFLIGGSVCFSLLPEVWAAFNPEGQVEVNQEASRKERAVYAEIDPTSISDFRIYGNTSFYGSAMDVEWHASVTLPGNFESKEQFSAAAAEILHALAKEDISDASIHAGNEQESYELFTNGVYAFADVTGEQLEKLVDHRKCILNQNMDYTSVTEARYAEMQENGLLVDAEALKQAYEEGKQDGYRDALEESERNDAELAG